MTEKKEYDWIEDPFKDDSDMRKGMSKGSKVFVGCGCLIVFVIMIFLIITLFDSFVSLMESW